MMHMLLLGALDLVGTVVFALSGWLDWQYGAGSICSAYWCCRFAGNAGGITRDVLIGATPPSAIADWRYLAVSVLAGVITFYRYETIERLRNPVQLSDAAGLALFAVAGAQKALAYGLNPTWAALLGMLTGIGGGMLRDVPIPADSHGAACRPSYAVAALAGAAVVVLGSLLQLPPMATTLAGAGLCFGLRYMAIRHQWHLPVARYAEKPDTDFRS